MSTGSELSLAVDQMIEARPETVFRLLTEPDLYVRWFGPPGAEVQVNEMEVALGGRLALEIRLPGLDDPIGIEGFYEVIEPPLRLVHSWRTLDDELFTTVSFELEPRGLHTFLRVNHQGFVDPIDLDRNQTGWIDHLSVLRTAAITLEGSAP